MTSFDAKMHINDSNWEIDVKVKTLDRLFLLPSSLSPFAILQDDWMDEKGSDFVMTLSHATFLEENRTRAPIEFASLFVRQKTLNLEAHDDNWG